MNGILEPREGTYIYNRTYVDYLTIFQLIQTSQFFLSILSDLTSVHQGWIRLLRYEVSRWGSIWKMHLIYDTNIRSWRQSWSLDYHDYGLDFFSISYDLLISALATLPRSQLNDSRRIHFSFCNQAQEFTASTPKHPVQHPDSKYIRRIAKCEDPLSRVDSILRFLLGWWAIWFPELQLQLCWHRPNDEEHHRASEIEMGSPYQENLIPMNQYSWWSGP